MKFIGTKYLVLILLIAICLFSSCNVLSQRLNPSGIDFSSLDIDYPQIEKTFQAAKANDKNVLVIFDAVWCGYCRKFNTITMKDSEVKKSLVNFEVVNIDVDKYPKAVKAFEKNAGGKIEGVPTLMIFSSDGVKKTRVTGFYKAQKFNNFLRKNL